MDKFLNVFLAVVFLGEIPANPFIISGEDDAAVAGRMLKDKTDKLKSFTGDGAYDDFALREILGSQVKQIIPPPKDAVLHKGSKKKPLKQYLKQRNEAVEFIEGHDRKEWKIKEGYHQRSLNELSCFDTRLLLRLA